MADLAETPAPTVPPEPQPPTPLPQLEWDRVQDPAASKAAEALTHWITRDRERLAQNTDLLSGGLAGVQSGLSGLLLRVKDTYTFGIPGTVKVTKPETFGLSLPYRVVADSTMVEVRADLWQGAGVVVSIRVDGAEVAQAVAGAGGTTTQVALTKDQDLSAWVIEAPATGAKGLMVQVRCG